jgi:DNA-binding protein H-NS
LGRPKSNLSGEKEKHAASLKEKTMQFYLREMSLEELWNLHEKIAGELTRKMTLEKAKLDERLSKLSSASHLFSGNVRRERRPYPKVLAKYRNPRNPKETWAGRGKQPRWLAAQLHSGKKLDQFLIRRSS